MGRRQPRALPESSATPKGRPITVLVVDDEPEVLTHVRTMLENFGISVSTALSSAEALERVKSPLANLALIDWLLGADDDGIVLGRTLHRTYGIPYVLFSGRLNVETTGNAYKQGAVDVIEKPIRPGRLLAAVNLAIRSPRGRVSSEAESVAILSGADSVSLRWAKMVLRAVRANRDPNTEKSVAEASARSFSAYRKLCDACEAGGHQTRDLVRMLRANALAQSDGSNLRSHLSSVDPRTWSRLCEEASVRIDSGFVPLATFLLGQRFVSPRKKCLQDLLHEAANDPLFFEKFDSEKQAGSDTIEGNRRRRG